MHVIRSQGGLDFVGKKYYLIVDTLLGWKPVSAEILVKSLPDCVTTWASTF